MDIDIDIDGVVETASEAMKLFYYCPVNMMKEREGEDDSFDWWYWYYRIVIG